MSIIPPAIFHHFLFHQVSDDEDEMEKARRELHAVDRHDWPPLSLTYGLPWEQYFQKRETELFEHSALATSDSNVPSAVSSPKRSSPTAGAIAHSPSRQRSTANLLSPTAGMQQHEVVRRAPQSNSVRRLHPVPAVWSCVAVVGLWWSVAPRSRLASSVMCQRCGVVLLSYGCGG